MVAVIFGSGEWGSDRRATAAPVTAHARAARHLSAFTGVWKMNRAESVFDPGPPFRSFTLTFAPDGVRHLDLVRADGHVFKAELPWSDGKAVQVTVKEGARQALEAVSRINGQTFDDVWRENGRVIEKVHGRRSADGKSLIVDVEGAAERGGTYRNRIVFARQ